MDICKIFKQILRLFPEYFIFLLIKRINFFNLILKIINKIVVCFFHLNKNLNLKKVIIVNFFRLI